MPRGTAPPPSRLARLCAVLALHVGGGRRFAAAQTSSGDSGLAAALRTSEQEAAYVGRDPNADAISGYCARSVRSPLRLPAELLFAVVANGRNDRRQKRFAQTESCPAGTTFDGRSEGQMFLGRTCAAASGANYMRGSWDLVPDCVTYTELCCTTILGAAFCATSNESLRLSELAERAAVRRRRRDGGAVLGDLDGRRAVRRRHLGDARDLRRRLCCPPRRCGGGEQIRSKLTSRSLSLSCL